MEAAGSDIFQAVVLAAGKGSRMGSDLPKVLLPLLGLPMLAYVTDVLCAVGIRHPVIVVGRRGEDIEDVMGDSFIYAHQPEQLGSGHAVMCAREAASGYPHLLVMCGDSPLFRVETVRSLMEEHLRSGAAVSLVSAVLDDPFGYGRIIRTAEGDVAGVVEEKLGTDEQKLIREVNGGCYAFDADWLWANLPLMHRNEAGEYCLTEMVDIAVSQGRRVIAVPCGADEVAGINTPAQLLAAEKAIESRL